MSADVGVDGELTVPTHDHWFEPLAEHLGSAYLRYSFTKGTVQEVDTIVELLGLEPGAVVLDVGCGPGRHAHELVRRGIAVHGVDISERFVTLAREGVPTDARAAATFERLDARNLADVARLRDRFDAAICLCQGAFGLMTVDGHDEDVLRGIASSVRAGGGVAVSAFSSYFAVKYHADADFDADSGISAERTELRSEVGEVLEAELWTGCYTPRELRLLARSAGLRVDAIHSVEPGAYGTARPTTESPEYLLVATREDG